MGQEKEKKRDGDQENKGEESYKKGRWGDQRKATADKQKEKKKNRKSEEGTSRKWPVEESIKTTSCTSVPF
jgi:hypothetical protein